MLTNVVVETNGALSAHKSAVQLARNKAVAHGMFPVVGATSNCRGYYKTVVWSYSRTVTLFKTAGSPPINSLYGCAIRHVVDVSPTISEEEAVDLINKSMTDLYLKAVVFDPLYIPEAFYKSLRSMVSETPSLLKVGVINGSKVDWV